MLPYATSQQMNNAWGQFVAGTGRTTEIDGTLFELSVQTGFCVWFVRVDETGDHYAIDQTEAHHLGLL